MSRAGVRVRRATALLAGLVLVLGGCSTPEATPSPSPTEAPEPTPVVTRFELGTTVWYAGLVITVQDAVATIDEKGGPVVVALHLEDPGAVPLSLDAPIRLTFGAHAYDVTHDTQLPEVPAGGAADAIATFQLAPGEPLRDAVLRFGRPADHQAAVPLGPGDVEAVTLEPRPVAVKGSGHAGELKLTLRDALLRWDLPDWGEELPKGVAALTITYDAAFTGTFAGGLALTADSIGLRLPDGRVIAPRRDGRSQTILALLPNAPATGVISRFEVPAGMTGTFALLLRDAGTEAAITFKITG